MWLFSGNTMTHFAEYMSGSRIHLLPLNRNGMDRETRQVVQREDPKSANAELSSWKDTCLRQITILETLSTIVVE